MNTTRSLLDTVAGDFTFGIGSYIEGDRRKAVLILHYPSWPRALLDLAAESLADGIDITIKGQVDGWVEIYLAARSRVTVTTVADGQTQVLRGPAWDARLSDIDAAVARGFERDWAKAGSWLLVLRGQRDHVTYEIDAVGGAKRSGRSLTLGALPAGMGDDDE